MWCKSLTLHCVKINVIYLIYTRYMAIRPISPQFYLFHVQIILLLWHDRNATGSLKSIMLQCLSVQGYMNSQRNLANLHILLYLPLVLKVPRVILLFLVSLFSVSCSSIFLIYADYARPLVDKIDTKHVLNERLYRPCTVST